MAPHTTATNVAPQAIAYLSLMGNTALPLISPSAGTGSISFITLPLPCLENEQHLEIF